VNEERGNARQIYQHLLDLIGDAVYRRDFEKYCSFFQIPHRIETSESMLFVHSNEDLRMLFDLLCKYLRQGDIAELIRNCTMAEYSDPHTIKGVHETRLIDTNNRILDSYSALSTLSLSNSVWRVSSSQYADIGKSLPSKILMECKEQE
jgi:hypothetical protein